VADRSFIIMSQMGIEKTEKVQGLGEISSIICGVTRTIRGQAQLSTGETDEVLLLIQYCCHQIV